MLYVRFLTSNHNLVRTLWRNSIVRRSLIAFAAASFAALSTIAVPAVQTQTPAEAPEIANDYGLADFDIRSAQFAAHAAPPAPAEIAGAKASREAALTAHPIQAEGLEVRWSTITGGPRTIVPIRGAITPPEAGSPAEIAERFVRERRDAYGLSDEDLAELRLAREYVTKDTGVTHLTFVQEANGRRVVGADLRVAVDASNRVVWAGGELVPGASAASKRNRWSLDATAAAETAARSIGAAVATPTVVAGKRGERGERYVELGDAFTEPAAVRETLFPLAPGATRPAWTVLLPERGAGNLYVVTLDAEKGTVLARHNLTRYLGGDPKAARFRVFTKDSPQPSLPSAGASPQAVDRELIALTPSILDASPQGWIAGDPVTIGNNVRAQEDRDANNSGGRNATGDDDFVFDPALDFPIRNSGNNTDAAIVNLFYWCNFVHDYFYRLGFDEGAGNFQATNFTGIGRGNDAVNADAQDGAGTNNANFSTPPDGQAPRMQMFLWSGGYDGSFDQTIIIHEYTHGLSTRLIGGPDYVDGLTGPQSGGMGEGWGDWYALTMLSDPAANPDGDYVVGGYARRNFYSGVRHFPYSTNTARNPLTYSDIDPATADEFNDPTEVHAVGEVWCQTLWDVRAKFIEAYGPVEGRRLVELLVTDGMKYSVNNPSFVEARDGILVADQVRTNGANQCLIWEGFAKRGVGYGAETLNGSATAVTESFDLPPWCTSEGKPSLDRASYDESETTAVLSVGDGDLIGQGSVEVRVTSTSGDEEAVTLARSANVPGLFAAELSIARGATTAGNGSLDVQLGDTITLAYDDASAGGAERTATARIVRKDSLFRDTLEGGAANFKAKLFKLTTEAAASPSHAWHDSPGGNYADESTYTLQIKRKFGLSGAVGSRLNFNHKLDTEPGYDLCIVEGRVKNGAWTTLAVFSGLQRTFVPVSVDLSRFDGQKKVQVRFSLVSDPFVNADGWFIDDVQVQTGRTQ
jgi:hypothetical protein